MNELHFGDNLDVLRAMPAESVDLIYLDPPFNSNANYNVIYGTRGVLQRRNLTPLRILGNGGEMHSAHWTKQRSVI